MYYTMFLRIPGSGYVSDSTILVSVCALLILILKLYRCQGTTILLLKKPFVCHTMLPWRAHYIITIPLGKIHRHVVDVLTVYPYHSVNSIDTWYLAWCLCCTWYLLVPWQACVFYRFIASLSLPMYRYSVGKVFLIVSFPNDNTETFGKISTTTVHILRFFDSIPTIFLSTFLAVFV